MDKGKRGASAAHGAVTEIYVVQSICSARNTLAVFQLHYIDMFQNSVHSKFSSDAMLSFRSLSVRVTPTIRRSTLISASSMLLFIIIIN